MPLRYKNGDKYCGFCGEWVKRKDIPTRTRLSKTGTILLCNICGMPIGQRPNVINQLIVKRFREKRKTPIRFKTRGLIKDIIANKEKWEALIKNPA